MRKLFSAVMLAFFILELSACSGGTAKNADLTSAMKKMKEKITNTQMMDLSSDDLMSEYGIKPGDVKQFAAYVDSTGTKGDEIVLVQANSSEAADRIKKDLDNRYSQKEVEMKDYLPDEYAVLKKCKVNKSGDYISMIVSPQYEELEKIYKNAFN